MLELVYSQGTVKGGGGFRGLVLELVYSQGNVKGGFQRAGVRAGLFTRKCEGKVSEGWYWSWFIRKEM